MQDTSNQANAVSLLTGLMPRHRTAAEFGVNPRTIIRWEHEGLPVIRVGRQRLHRIDAVRTWLLARESAKAA